MDNEPLLAGPNTAESRRHLAAPEYNELTPVQPLRIWHTAAEVLREPILLLIAAGGIYLLPDDT